ncbi:hypothetical protein, partial [Enterobacter hormaechei]|uniref:hypothetical protein n=1 Tax=Enterobacter hormaechei TaxID=158836 RepID=UPI001D104F16
MYRSDEFNHTLKDKAVPYKHLNLPTKREVVISVGAGYFKQKKQSTKTAASLYTMKQNTHHSIKQATQTRDQTNRAKQA